MTSFLYCAACRCDRVLLMYHGSHPYDERCAILDQVAPTVDFKADVHVTSSTHSTRVLPFFILNTSSSAQTPDVNLDPFSRSA
jgi:hypothetical protein